MPNKKLTASAVDKLASPAGQTTYWDTLLPGFGLRVGKKRKTWVINTRVLVQGRWKKKWYTLDIYQKAKATGKGADVPLK